MIDSELEFVTIRDAARILSEARETTRRRVRSGELPSQKLPGDLGPYLILRSDVMRLRDSLIAEAETRLEVLRAGVGS
ncbi:MAG TPA: hypothetical protein PLV68_17905 [Ilumatobacteraceae bacterium]|nr:hypothetical protein [Ilumatobacteraceae bacterium]